MYAALLDRFLQLLSMNYKDNFNLIKNRNPNMSFMDCFQWFLTTYAHTDEADHEENKATMNMEWHIDDSFPKLARAIDDAILYAQFANAPITNQDAVDAGMRMIMTTDVF